MPFTVCVERPAKYDSVIYASGRYDGPARVIKSTDGGGSWTSMDLSAHAGTLIDIYFFSPDSGIVVGGSPSGVFPNTISAVVLSTFDGGLTWQTRHTSPRISEWCWKISFPTPDTGYVSIEIFSGETYVLKTVDRGLTWDEKLVGENVRVQGIGFATGTLGWLGILEKQVFQTEDGGETWQGFELGNTVINRFRMLSDTLGYAAGSSVYKFSRKPTSVSVQKIEIPSRFSLEQNYPNPFNPTTAIQFKLPQMGQVVLKIYNLYGQVVAILADSKYAAGLHRIEWDGKDDHGNPLSSGLYMVEMRAGVYRQVQKMSLLR